MGVLECRSIGVLEYWSIVFKAALHYSITPLLQFKGV